jgi:hypothetical protein
MNEEGRQGSLVIVSFFHRSLQQQLIGLNFVAD